MIHRDRSQVQKTAKLKDFLLTHPCLSKEMKKKYMSINIIFWNLHRRTQKVITQTSSLPSSVPVGWEQKGARMHKDIWSVPSSLLVKHVLS